MSEPSRRGLRDLAARSSRRERARRAGRRPAGARADEDAARSDGRRGVVRPRRVALDACPGRRRGRRRGSTARRLLRARSVLALSATARRHRLDDDSRAAASLPGRERGRVLRRRSTARSGIERPPPPSGLATVATDLSSLATIRGLRYFSPATKKRLVVVFTDGESSAVSNARVGTLYRQPPAIDSIFVHVWDRDERVYARGVPEAQYLPDPSCPLDSRPARGVDARLRLRRRRPWSRHSQGSRASRRRADRRTR